MRRQATFAILMLLASAPCAWAIFKKKDQQKILNNHVLDLQEQLQTMGNQVGALNAQVAEMTSSSTWARLRACRQGRN